VTFKYSYLFTEQTSSSTSSSLFWLLLSFCVQLSLLPLAGWEMSTGQRVVMLCSREVKAGMAHSTCR